MRHHNEHHNGHHHPSHDEGRGGRRFRHGGPPFGRGPEGFGGGRRMGRRSKRGDVRAAVLLLIGEGPRNGYQLIQELAERSNGAWRPSPGSIYPVLSQLEDEGLVAVDPTQSGRTYQLTPAGSAYLDEHRAALGKPWEEAAASVGGPTSELISTTRQVAAAARQVLEAGTEAQVTQAVAVLAEARRGIYKILAEDPSPTL